jgi:predicted AAA+ superfamily ATPase
MYKKRLIEKILREYIEDFPAVLVEGAKAVGKTSTCKQFSKTVFELDSAETRELIELSPQTVFSKEKPILIDEWQRLPEFWERIRREVDNGLQGGSILLSGSNPNMFPRVHSGSARIERLTMRPFSIEEREMTKTPIRIADLLKDEFVMPNAESEWNLEGYLDEIYRSGFPALRIRSERAIRRSIDGYIQNIIEHEFKENSIVVRKPQALLSWLTAYAAASATTTAFSTILQAVEGNSDRIPSEKTVIGYREILSALGIVKELKPWLEMGKLFPNLGKTPKHFLVDPALIVSLLSLDKEIVLSGQIQHPIGKLNKTFIGQLFESFIYQSLATYAEVNEAKLRHLRLSNGSKEIDFLMQKGRKLLAIEVKAKTALKKNDTDNLNWFETQIKDEFKVVKIILYMGKYVYTREDGIHMIPASLLGS